MAAFWQFPLSQHSRTRSLLGSFCSRHSHTRFFTSGTTGLLKAAIVSWQKVNCSTGFYLCWAGLRRADRFYTSMPLYLPLVGEVFRRHNYWLHAPVYT